MGIYSSAKTALFSLCLMLFVAGCQQQAKVTPLPESYSNSLGQRYVLIEAGEFTMGSTEKAETIAGMFGERETLVRDEYPSHQVTLTKNYLMAETEVTFSDYKSFLSQSGYVPHYKKQGLTRWKDKRKRHDSLASWSRPGFKQTSYQPVVGIDINDVTAFIVWLNEHDLTKPEGTVYSLPTEAQWEYACKAGSDTLFYWNNDVEVGNRYMNGADQDSANFHGFRYGFAWSDGYLQTAPVKSFEPNDFGMYDMSGNAYEWVEDSFSKYANAPVTDPENIKSVGGRRIIKGGAWDSSPITTRCAHRKGHNEVTRTDNIGFRLILEKK